MSSYQVSEVCQCSKYDQGKQTSLKLFYSSKMPIPPGSGKNFIHKDTNQQER